MQIKIKSNSWHWRLASTYSTLTADSAKYGDLNSCKYIRHVIWGSLNAAFITLLITGALMIVGDFFLWLFMLAVHGWVSPNMPAFMAMLICCIAAFSAVCFGIAKLFYSSLGAMEQNAFIELVKTKHKKICRPVVITEE